jgi:hypothetical protein
MKNATGLVFKLRVIQHLTKEEELKIVQFRIVMEIVNSPDKKGRWSFVTEDPLALKSFPLGQEFSLTAILEQQQLVK